MEYTAEALVGRIRKNCLACNGSGPRARFVQCTNTACRMHMLHKRHFRGTDEELLRAVRAYCLDCMGDMRSLVRNCENTSCAMYPIRDVAALTEG
jgi:hypothetical protein